MQSSAYDGDIIANRFDDARLYEAFEDHALMRFVAVNLLRTRATDVRFSARLKLVQETFLRHATAEEDWGFPKAPSGCWSTALRSRRMFGLSAE